MPETVPGTLPTSTDHERRGVIAGLLAYGWWGFFPLYFKAIRAVPLGEVVAHRYVWSLVVLAAILALRGDLRATPRLLRDGRLAATLLLSAFLLSFNWLFFIYAVGANLVLQASLGYFMNPLVNVLLGCLFLKERLSARQWVSIALAGVGVSVLTVLTGSLPWISLILAFSFGSYGLVRKVASVGPLRGHAIETAMLAPFALAYLLWLGWHGRAAFPGPSMQVNLLLPVIGLASVMPLLCFVYAARRLRYSTIGFLQYITPTMQFLLAVAVFGETFGVARLTGFAFIWAGLALYSWETWSQARARRTESLRAPSAPSENA
ncbi:MAG: chloramphenicol-sensitive protein RarD [Candidatus Sumerlaeota bacterium]|nr:chloramphenicol-sensitive protein RarD [Candidatus Sumerlaeota bacterium]